MTEENQRRRATLTEIETIVHETFASQPLEDDGDCVRCGMALDRGMGRISALCYKYALDTLPVSDMACRVCRTPLDESSIHRVWFGGPGEAPAAVVLCKHCYDFATASIRFVRKGAQ